MKIPLQKNMPHEEDFDDDNYESIEEKENSSVKSFPCLWFVRFLHTIFWCVNVYDLMCKEAYHTFYL